MEKCTNAYCNVCQRTAMKEVYFSQYNSPNIVIVPTVSFESGPPAKKLKLDISNEEIPKDISQISPEEPSISFTELEIPSSNKGFEIDIMNIKEPNDLQSNNHQQPEVNSKLKETNDTAVLSSNMEIIKYNKDEVSEIENDVGNHFSHSVNVTDDDKRVKTLLSSILPPSNDTIKIEQYDGDSERDTKIKDKYKPTLNNSPVDKIISQSKGEKPNTSKGKNLKTTPKEATHSSSNSKKVTSKPPRKLSIIKNQCSKCKTHIINSKNEKSCKRNTNNSLKESKGRTLRSKQHNKTKDSLTSKIPTNDKANTQTKISSTSPIKSVVHITQNYDLNGSPGKFNRNRRNQDDLRKLLSTKRDNLVVSVPNSKIKKKYTRAPCKIPQKNTQKIKLIINVICQKPEGKKIKAKISDENPLQTSVDVSFLDDFDVDDIVESLNVSRKEINNKLDDVNTSNIESKVKFSMNELITASCNLVKTEPPEDSLSNGGFQCQESKQLVNHDVNNMETEFNKKVKEEVCAVKPCDVEEKSLIKPHESFVIIPNNTITPETVSVNSHMEKGSNAMDDNIENKTNVSEQEIESNLNSRHDILDIKLGVSELNKENILSNLSNRNISVKELNTEVHDRETGSIINKSKGDTKMHHYNEKMESNNNGNKVKHLKNTGGDNNCDRDLIHKIKNSVVRNKDKNVTESDSSVLMKFYVESEESFNSNISTVPEVDVHSNNKLLNEDYKEAMDTLIVESNNNLNKDYSCLIESNNDNNLSLKLNNNTVDTCLTTIKNNEDTELTKSKNNGNFKVLLNDNAVTKSTELNNMKISTNIVCNEKIEVNDEISIVDNESSLDKKTSLDKIEPINKSTAYEINENKNSLGLKYDNKNVTESVIIVSDLEIKATHNQIMTIEFQQDGQKLTKDINHDHNNKIGLNKECTDNSELNNIITETNNHNNETMKKTNSGESNNCDDDKLNNTSTKDMNNKKNITAEENKKEYSSSNRKNVLESNVTITMKNITESRDVLSEKTLETKSQMQIKKDLKIRIKEYLGLDYEICALLHSGKYSYVYSCKDPNGKILAAKVSRANQKDWLGINKETMLRQLQNSVPKENFNLVFFINGFAISRHWCFLTEYYPRNLAEYLGETHKGFHINDVQRLSRQLIKAVMVLRHNNIVHSDIKPAHILLNNALDRLKLCGFDAMRYHDDRFTVLPNIGITKYRAPEIILGFSASYSIDVWSTALIMYEMATARPLFSGLFNNTILYEQMLLLGNLPEDMLYTSPYRSNHFSGKYFMRRFGAHGQHVNYISHFTKSNRLATSVYRRNTLQWASTRTKREMKIDEAKIDLFLHLLEQMLALHPNARLPIEFAFADAFIYEAFN